MVPGRYRTDLGTVPRH